MISLFLAARFEPGTSVVPYAVLMGLLFLFITYSMVRRSVLFHKIAGMILLCLIALALTLFVHKGIGGMAFVGIISGITLSPADFK